MGLLISRVKEVVRVVLPAISISTDERRELQDRLRVHRTELRDLKNTLEESSTDLPYAEYSEELLSDAEDALAGGNVESFWRSVAAAKRWEILTLSRLQEHYKPDPDTDSEHGLNPLQVRAQGILLEATNRLNNQSNDRIEDLLGDGTGAVGDPETIDILAATKLLYNGLIREYRARKRYRILKRQLGYFILIGLASATSILFLWHPIYAENIQIPQLLRGEVLCFLDVLLGRFGNICFLSMIFIFGVLGATTSSILSLSRGLRGSDIPERVGSLGLTLGRVTVGGTSALVIFVFLIAGIIEIVTLTPGTAFAFAFVGGFTERLLMRAVESIAGTDQIEVGNDKIAKK